MIANFFKERAARAARKRHMDGYEYAAGALLSTNGLAETIRDWHKARGQLMGGALVLHVFDLDRVR